MRSKSKRWIVLCVALVLAAVPVAASAQAGFSGPLFGLATAPGGDLFVADVGAGIHTLSGGAMVDTIALPGATDVSPFSRNGMWATTTGADPVADTGQGVYRIVGGQPQLIANLFAFEEAVNPDGNDPFDSNPFDVAAINANAALVADAGANALLRVNRNGNVRVLAVFPDELVSTDNIKALAGCPSPAPFCALPDQMPAQAVPTSVAIGPDGHYYVGELRGFPGPTNASSIWRVSPRANGALCPNPDCTKVFDGGFTSIIDLAFAPNGRLMVAEMDEQSWAAVEIFETGVGGTVNGCDLNRLRCGEVTTGIPMLTAIAFDTNRSLWATENSLIPPIAQVIPVP